ncbi:MAG: EfeM/EfeO family lipoprotein [Acidimicrobiales bacterium]
MAHHQPVAGPTATRRWRPRPWQAAVPTALAAVLAAAGAAPTSGGTAQAQAGPGAAARSIAVSSTACAPGWHAPPSGRTVFTIDNVSAGTVYEVDLVGASQTSVYGEIEMLAPGTTDTMDVVLPPGRYLFICNAFSGAVLRSAVEQVVGPPVSGTYSYTPVGSHELELATSAYRASVTQWLQRLGNATDALESAVKSGELARARQLWLPAHLDYERLGGAYGAFAEFNAEIDGTPLSLQGGVTSPYFTGFFALEYGLWGGQTTSQLFPTAAALDQAVHSLGAQFPHLPMVPGDLALDTYQILENTMQYEMTGETDEGSNTNLATAWANVEGTELALNALGPALHQSSPAVLPRLRAALAALAAAFKSYEAPDGTWEHLQSLTTLQHEALDGQLGATLEELSVVPELLQPLQPAASGS